MQTINDQTRPHVSIYADVGPDVDIGPGACVMTGAVVCRGVKLGKGVHVGHQALILANVTVPDWAIIDNGAIIPTGHDWSSHKRWNR